MYISFPMSFLSGAPGAGEIILIFVVILLLFGPKRLPEIARMIGRTLDELRKASQDFKDQIMAIDEDPPDNSSGTDDPNAFESGEHEYGEGDGEYGENWDGMSAEDEHQGDDYGYEDPPDSGDGFADDVAASPEKEAGDEAVTGDDEPVDGAADPDVASDETAQEEDKHDLAG